MGSRRLEREQRFRGGARSGICWRDYLSKRTPPQQDWRRLRLLLWLYDYVCLLWSQLYLTRAGEQRAGLGIAERARLLDARLRLPAHYAA